MGQLETRMLGSAPDDRAPDGSDVRVLVRVARGSMAHFELAPQCTSRAVRHKTVEELWFFLTGRGEMWRRHEGHEDVVQVHPGIAISIPAGTCFQFRSHGYTPLAAVGVTMPPWPGPDESEDVDGPWGASF